MLRHERLSPQKYLFRLSFHVGQSMPSPIKFRLCESGDICDTESLNLHPVAGVNYQYGEILRTHLGFLDDCADVLSLRQISSFVEFPNETEHEPRWHDPVDGLNTFEPLLTELIERLGTDDTFAGMEKVIWELRICELILRHTEIRCEQFYLYY